MSECERMVALIRDFSLSVLQFCTNLSLEPGVISVISKPMQLITFAIRTSTPGVQQNPARSLQKNITPEYTDAHTFSEQTF